MLKNLILSAAAAGVVAGLLTAGLQHVTTTPIIIEAEQYERVGEAAPTAHQHSSLDVVLPDSAIISTHAGHPAEEWAPADGVERTFYTSLATTVTGVGFALMLLGAMMVAGVPVTARTGLAFGAGGFVAFALAPALGLPPEIPGSGAAELFDRQIWWTLTAAATAFGLAGAVLGRNLGIRGAGIALTVVPHVIGAPHPEAFASTAPAELAGHFAAASLAVTAAFWAALGTASGAFYERFSRSS